MSGAILVVEDEPITQKLIAVNLTLGMLTVCVAVIGMVWT